MGLALIYFSMGIVSAVRSLAEEAVLRQFQPEGCSQGNEFILEVEVRVVQEDLVFLLPGAPEEEGSWSGLRVESEILTGSEWECATAHFLRTEVFPGYA